MSGCGGPSCRILREFSVSIAKCWLAAPKSVCPTRWDSGAGGSGPPAFSANRNRGSLCGFSGRSLVAPPASRVRSRSWSLGPGKGEAGTVGPVWPLRPGLGLGQGSREGPLSTGATLRGSLRNPPAQPGLSKQINCANKCWYRERPINSKISLGLDSEASTPAFRYRNGGLDGPTPCHLIPWVQPFLEGPPLNVSYLGQRPPSRGEWFPSPAGEWVTITQDRSHSQFLKPRAQPRTGQSVGDHTCRPS